MTLSRTLGLVVGCGIAIATAAFADGAAPKGWFLAGSHPKQYDSGLDKDVAYRGGASAFLRSKADVKEKIDGFGTLMQQASPGEYRGKRVRMSAFVKSADVTDWAGLWLRIDGKKREPLAFDNMEDRAIKGTSDWTRHEIVLDVADDAQGIAYGILLSDRGSVWLDDLRFEIVDKSVPATDRMKDAGVGPDADQPRNGDFEEGQ